MTPEDEKRVAELRQHENVAEAVILHRPLVDGDDDADLVAYVTARARGSVSEREMRAYIADRLPSHMVPRAYVFLAELPHLSSGKVDRNALPAPGRGRRAEFASPRDAVDELMVTLWSDVLGQPPVGIDDHFFNDLQGHSLLATRLVTRVRETFRTDIPLALIFEHSTVRSFTDALRSHPDHGEGMERIAEVLVQVAGLSDDEVSRLLGAT